MNFTGTIFFSRAFYRVFWKFYRYFSRAQFHFFYGLTFFFSRETLHMTRSLCQLLGTKTSHEYPLVKDEPKLNFQRVAKSVICQCADSNGS